MTRNTLLLLVLWTMCTVNCSTILPTTTNNSTLVENVPTDSTNGDPTNSTVNPKITPRRPIRIKCEEHNSYKFRSRCIEECGGTVDDEDNDFKQTADKKSVHSFTYKLVILESDEFTITTNGSLNTSLSEPFTLQPPKNFIQKNGTAYLCFPMPEEFKNCPHWLLTEDEIQFKNEHRMLWVQVHNRHYKLWEYMYRKAKNDIAVCPTEASDAKKRRDMALQVAWLLSLLCLGVLIVLSQMFPILNMKNNKILLCNLSVLFVAYLTLTIKKMVSSLSNGPCIFMAYFQQYAFLSAFCWINVQAVDVFLKFISLRVSHVDKVQDRRKFILYSVHGWITPLLITAITGIVEAFDAPNMNPKMSDFCWFKKEDKGIAFLYFFGPITLILFINLILFIITVYKLCTIGKGSNVMKKGIKKELFKVYIKLIFVMGLSWTMEVISVGVGSDEQHWNVPDMINALQGVFIFIVYTCKRIFMRRLFNLMCRHPKCPTWWPWKPNSMSPAEATHSTANSSGGTMSQCAMSMDKL